MTSTADSARAPKIAAARLSIASNVTLVVLKLAVGLRTGSVGVLSEAAHSANDLVAAAIAFMSVRVSDKSPDERHPYGHGKVESISGLVEALLIFGAAAYIAWEAVHKLVHGPSNLMALPGVAVMAVSAIANVCVSRRLFQVAAETDSLALRADAEHLRTDVVTSGGVFLALLVVHLTGWTVLDPLVAIAVAGIICVAAYRLTRDAIHGLVDTSLPDHDLNIVRDVLDAAPGVLAYHKLRSRKSGSSRHVDAHVLVADNLTLQEAHQLTEELEDQIRARLPRAEVMLHTEPHDAEVAHQRDAHGQGPGEASD